MKKLKIIKLFLKYKEYKCRSYYDEIGIQLLNDMLKYFNIDKDNCEFLGDINYINILADIASLNITFIYPFLLEKKGIIKNISECTDGGLVQITFKNDLDEIKSKIYHIDKNFRNLSFIYKYDKKTNLFFIAYKQIVSKCNPIIYKIIVGKDDGFAFNKYIMDSSL